MPKFSVKKPFTVLVGVIIAVVIGIVSLFKMPLDLLPEINLPYLLVITTYPGASPEKVEEDVCKPMESALGTVTGVENVYGICNENYAMVELEFQDGTNLDSAMVKVTSALNTLQANLPEDCGTPSVIEIGTDLMASEYLAVSMEGMSIEELTQFVKDEITPTYERQEGVASVSELGLVEKSIQVELNEEKVRVLNDKILASLDSSFADALEQLDDAKEQLNDSTKTLQESKDKLIDSQADLNESKQDLVDGQAELNTKKGELAQSEIDLEENKDEINDGIESLKKGREEAYNQLAELSLKMDEAAQQIASIKATIRE
ncbi:MAG: efflux RND transporter permease subunit, partial [Lachnospiraceae bacterium]|nr:efflux RND transporter permease subunit [Lachnospiraceae bacterium]